MKILVGIILLSLIGASGAFAQNYQSTATATNTFNVTISTATQIFGYDGTSMAWTIHPENGNIRCTWGGPNGSTSPPTPSSTVGTEFVQGGYYNAYPVTNPTLAVSCAPESGSVTISGERDFK